MMSIKLPIENTADFFANETISFYPEVLYPEAISTEGIVLDENLVEYIMASSKGEDIVVRTTVVDEKPIYEIIWGAHTVEALKRIGIDRAEAIIIDNCSNELLHDYRIISAQQTPNVKIPNIIFEVQNAFYSAKWSIELAQKMSTGQIAVEQVFNLVLNKSSGEDLGLQREETKELKSWVEGKTRLWGLSLSYTHRLLRIAGKSDP